MADRPRGMLRLNVTSAADSFLSGATLGGFLNLKRHPEVRLEITVSNRLPDIVVGGYAGMRLGESSTRTSSPSRSRNGCG